MIQVNRSRPQPRQFGGLRSGLSPSYSSGQRRIGHWPNGDTRIVDFLAARDSAERRFQRRAGADRGRACGLDHARDIAHDAQRTVGHGRTEAVELLSPLPAPRSCATSCVSETFVQAFTQILASARLRPPIPKTPARTSRSRARSSRRSGRPPELLQADRSAVCGTGRDVAWPASSKTIDYRLNSPASSAPRVATFRRTRPAPTSSATPCSTTFPRRDERRWKWPPIRTGQRQGTRQLDPVGPCITAADEIPDPYALEIIIASMARRAGADNSRGMHWKYRGLHCLRVARRDDPCRRVLFGRQSHRLRSRNRTLCRTGRNRRA